MIEHDREEAMMAGMAGVRKIGLLAVAACAALLSLTNFAWSQETKAQAPPRDPSIEERIADLEAITNSSLPVVKDRKSNVSTSAGDNAWLLVSCALVLMMTGPGLALFYGGLVRTKDVLSTFMHSMFLMCLVSVIWLVFGYSVAFGDGNSFIGSFTQYFMLKDV